MEENLVVCGCSPEAELYVLWKIIQYIQHLDKNAAIELVTNARPAKKLQTQLVKLENERMITEKTTEWSAFLDNSPFLASWQHTDSVDDHFLQHMLKQTMDTSALLSGQITGHVTYLWPDLLIGKAARYQFGYDHENRYVCRSLMNLGEANILCSEKSQLCFMTPTDRFFSISQLEDKVLDYLQTPNREKSTGKRGPTIYFPRQTPEETNGNRFIPVRTRNTSEVLQHIFMKVRYSNGLEKIYYMRGVCDITLVFNKGGIACTVTFAYQLVPFNEITYMKIPSKVLQQSITDDVVLMFWCKKRQSVLPTAIVQYQ